MCRRADRRFLVVSAVAQPSGEVTLVFSDIEGSTRLLAELGTEAYREALGEHRRVVRESYGRYAGYEVDYEGDAFFYTFASAVDAVAAVSEAMAALEQGPIAIRVGIHTGTPGLDPPKYVGMDVHFAARVMSSAHGGQVVLSQATRERVGVKVTELGEHRLKDIEAPVALFQLGEGSFPPLKTISNTNLPTPVSSFLGREDELYEADLLLQGTRLLTVTGPGGAGKTRFALELARRAREERFSDYPAGVFSCFLAPLRDPGLVLPTIARTLTMADQPGTSALDALASHFEGKSILLLLDNAEHLLAAAPEVAELLERAAGVTVLVTSRELLRLRGETLFELPPLAEDDGVALFCARAQVEPSVEIRELCARLEGLPLAIELAAARLRILTPEQLLKRLSQRLDLLKASRDADPRQQTLRTTIEWSYDLLAPADQQLFARLAVFAGGCSLEAAEQVAGADVDTLQSLVDKSLLRYTDGRCWMLETIREFAGELLEASREAEAVRERHTRHFLALVDDLREELHRNDRSSVELLEREHDNLRALLDRLEAADDSDRFVGLVGALWRFWYLRGHYAEGRRRLERALALDIASGAARGRVLHGAAVMTVNLGDTARARQFAEEALELQRSIGDETGAAYSVLLLGNLTAEEGEMAAAEVLLAESVRMLHGVGEEDLALVAAGNLAWAASELGDRDRARALHEENLSRARQLSNRRVEAISLALLAVIAADEGRLREAHSTLAEAVRIAVELEDPVEVAIDFCRFASILAACSRPRAAIELLSRADRLREEVGAAFDARVATMNQKTLSRSRADLGEAGFAAAWERGGTLTVDDAVELALSSLD
jgi:predicted ATPase/class 3 adenylate cyclase